MKTSVKILLLIGAIAAVSIVIITVDRGHKTKLQPEPVAQIAQATAQTNLPQVAATKQKDAIVVKTRLAGLSFAGGHQSK